MAEVKIPNFIGRESWFEGEWLKKEEERLAETSDRGDLVNEQDELDAAFAALYRSPAGRRVMAYWRKITIEEASFFPQLGMDKATALGLFREGQDELIRNAELRAARHRNRKDI